MIGSGNPAGFHHRTSTKASLILINSLLKTALQFYSFKIQWEETCSNIFPALLWFIHVSEDFCLCINTLHFSDPLPEKITAAQAWSSFNMEDVTRDVDMEGAAWKISAMNFSAEDKSKVKWGNGWCCGWVLHIWHIQPSDLCVVS